MKTKIRDYDILNKRVLSVSEFKNHLVYLNKILNELQTLKNNAYYGIDCKERSKLNRKLKFKTNKVFR